MLRVTVEYVTDDDRVIGRGPAACFRVYNTGEGDGPRGGKYDNYAAEGHLGGREHRRASLGLVKRTATSPLHLVVRALNALGYFVPDVPRDDDMGRCEARLRDLLSSRTFALTDEEVESAVVAVFGKAKKGATAA